MKKVSQFNQKTNVIKTSTSMLGFWSRIPVESKLSCQSRNWVMLGWNQSMPHPPCSLSKNGSHHHYKKSLLFSHICSLCATNSQLFLCDKWLLKLTILSHNSLPCPILFFLKYIPSCSYSPLRLYSFGEGRGRCSRHLGFRKLRW